MALIADALLLAAALTAAVYCHVLAGRLKRLRSLDGGVGQAVAAMSAQVEEMRTALKAAKAASGESTRTLAERTARAEMAAGRLELLLAALHDREGTDPVNLSERRAAAGRSATRVEPFSRARSVRAEPAAAASPMSADAPDPDPETQAGSIAGSPDPAAEEDADALQTAPPPTSPSPAQRGRRLFRVDGEAVSTPGKPLDDGPTDEAAALRAALEALAKETAE